MKIHPALLFLLLLFLLPVLAFIGLNLWIDRSLVDITTAKSSDDPAIATLIEKGWIPFSLPPDSSQIHEAHDLDSNAIILTFISTSPADAFTSGACTRATVPVDKLRLARNASNYVKWWPEEKLESMLQDAEAAVYKCEFPGKENVFYLAVDDAGKGTGSAFQFYMWHDWLK